MRCFHDTSHLTDMAAMPECFGAPYLKACEWLGKEGVCQSTPKPEITKMLQSHQLDQFSETVESIYDAALEPSRWPVAAGKIAAMLGSPKAVLFALRADGLPPGFVFTYGIPDEFVNLWDGRYANDDVWTKAALEGGFAKEGNVITGEQLVPDKRFLASAYYQNFLKPQNVGRLLAGVIFDGTSPQLPLSVCSVLRSRDDAAFADLDRQLHRLITNHLSKAMGTMFRLRDAELRVASSLAALERVPSAILLVAADGKVRFANTAAERIVRTQDGVSLRHVSPLDGGLGELIVSEVSVQEKLDQLLTVLVSDARGDAADHFSQALRVRRPSGAADYLIQVAPLGRENEYSDGGRQIRAIVFITDPAASEHVLDAAMLMSTYRLTPAEARVAQELLLGDGLKAIGLRMDITENTVKAHLKGIFAKTKANRQSQLIKLLLSLPRQHTPVERPPLS